MTKNGSPTTEFIQLKDAVAIGQDILGFGRSISFRWINANVKRYTKTLELYKSGDAKKLFVKKQELLKKIELQLQKEQAQQTNKVQALIKAKQILLGGNGNGLSLPHSYYEGGEGAKVS